MNAVNMEPGVSPFTSLVSRYCIRKSLKLSDTLNNEIEDILSFSQLMGHCLIDSQTSSWDVKLTALSGLGGKITLTLTPSKSLRKSEWLDSSSKKHPKKSSKSGRSSRGLK